MGRLDEIVSEQFHRFEQRCRGYRVWPAPVAPEPPFSPFAGYFAPRTPPGHDDGRRPGFFASIFESLEKAVKPPEPPPIPVEEPEPEPEFLEREDLVEVQAILPAKLDISGESFRVFLEQLTVCQEPIAFEVLGSAAQTSVQFATSQADFPILRRQVRAFFPEVTFLEGKDLLLSAWAGSGEETAIVEFGLGREFMLPLASGGRLDPFVGILGALSELAPEELALFQVLFQPAKHNWTGSVWRAVTDEEGRARFANQPALTIRTKEKLASPLYGAVVRIATKAADFDRAWGIARELAFSLGDLDSNQTQKPSPTSSP